MSRGRSLVQAIWGHKVATTGSLLLLWTALAAACTTAADTRAAQEQAWQALQIEADKLFAAMVQVADERELPVARRDDQRRRITTEWTFDSPGEPPEVRRRYFLAVIVHPSAGMALRARIDREAPTGDGVTGPIFEPFPRDAAVSEEEDGIVQRAYEIYQE